VAVCTIGKKQDGTLVVSMERAMLVPKRCPVRFGRKPEHNGEPL
jgi:hypothetical protein